MSVGIQKTASNTSSSSINTQSTSPHNESERSSDVVTKTVTSPLQSTRKLKRQDFDAMKKRKRRTTGNFECDFEGCTKIFTRAEHLSRHKLNHNPLVIYKCGWEGCNKTFVRSDLKDRHLRRHVARLRKAEEQRQLELKSKKNSLFKGMGTLTFNNLNLENIKPANVKDSQAIEPLLLTNTADSNNETLFDNGASITVMDLKQSEDQDTVANEQSTHLSESTSNTLNENNASQTGDLVKILLSNADNTANVNLRKDDDMNVSDLDVLDPHKMNTVLNLQRSSTSLFSKNQNFSSTESLFKLPAIRGVSSNTTNNSAPANIVNISSALESSSDLVNVISNDGFPAKSLPLPVTDNNKTDFDIFPEQLVQTPLLRRLEKELESELEIPSSPTNISNWIDSNLMSNFVDVNVNGFDGQNMLTYSSNNDFFFGLSPNAYINEIFQSVMPQLANSNDSQEYLISAEAMSTIISAIPSLAHNKDCNQAAFQRCLQIYWQLFHIQFPFLHRPSFVASKAPGLLVLSMVMLGAGLVSSTGTDETEFITNSRSLADAICVPLRWKLFESSDFELPVKTWVIQSLLILEYYEKFFASRNLHERTYVHHGAVIQLLRRSPTLGGNPTKSSHRYSPNVEESEEFAGKNDEEKRKLLWEKWIEFESLKRTTLMAFYIDSTHSIIFGHLGILYAHQIQVEMPCDDDLWESNGSNFNLPTADLHPRPFLRELRSLLKNQPVKTGVFGKRILMSGLLAIIFQLQQRDLQTSALGWEGGKEGSWKEYLSYILDYLTHDNMHGCCDTKSAVLIQNDTEDVYEPSGENSLRSYFAKNDTRCKYPAYHIAHIIMRISHYDLVIYSGAPWRMNVRPEDSDYKLVKARIEKWANSTSGKVSVVHALLYLFEMFLTPQNYNYETTNPLMKNYKYECLNDPIVERSYVIYIATLAVWAYCFTVEGPETNILSRTNGNVPANIGLVPEEEDGYSFLRRIRNELSRKTSTVLHANPASNAPSFHQIVLVQAKLLPTIKNKKNITGLLRVVAVSLGKSNWQLAREFSLLFKHCVERSLGSEDLYCRNYFGDSSSVYH